ncbi:E3 ubiquitin-protein ligase PUB23-like [Olea europaea var. sylvestris]|uniref:U-box domain-containing protein n=1 Tax=Olea europaea subsp. europaea TaxID=158383 RepID=A0A8S0QLR8_OLEEU|nr:E3 ubiquitin-protein ligase PUB23-like [Olea europaea var. sylvestris]CAA2966388.1 E3 ubiquitin- ligase PUB23-like [Olea europaea subsp. europaea]
MDEIEIPSYFLCPISLEIMKDPVTISTGITYDRESIEKWLFSQKNNTCPVTKQVVIGSELTPNITLRRFIQSWCTLHAPDGVKRLPTPKAPISKTQLLKLFNDAKSPNMQMKCLQRLRSIASHNEANKRFMETAGTAEFLASLIVKKDVEASSAEVSEDVIELRRASNEALSILYHLQLSGSGLKSLLESNIELIESLTSIMQSGNYDSRVYAVMLLKSMFEVADSNQPINLRTEFFLELVDILNDQISQKASKATLETLISVCPWGRNRIKAVEAGAVPLLIDLLLDSSDKRASELMLMVLDLLCQCAEGRAELLNHSAGLAIVSKKILRVSSAANKSGIKILHSISKFSATPGVLQEMLQIGAVTKLCLVLQVFDRGSKTKEKAREILKLHARAWRNSSCIPTHLLASYPS